MTSSRRQAPVRWRDRGADLHALESRAAALANAAKQVPALGPQALDRIRSRALAGRPSRGRFAFTLGPARVRWAFGIGILLVCGTTAGAAGMLWRKYVSVPRREAAVPAPLRPPRHPSRSVATQVASDVGNVGDVGDVGNVGTSGDVDKAPAVPVAAEVEVRRAPRRGVAPVGSAVPLPLGAAPGPNESLPQVQATEARLVAEALSDLRQHDDPHAALLALDRYAREFPHGVLETEALRTRLEAVLRLDDRKTALALLDGRSGLPRDLGADLLLTRAELRASVGRFRDALGDFTQLLDGAAGSLAPGGEERALYGRAVSLGRLTENERARADLLAYQRRFPDGRFAAEVQRLLAGRAQSPRP